MFRPVSFYGEDKHRAYHHQCGALRHQRNGVLNTIEVGGNKDQTLLCSRMRIIKNKLIRKKVILKQPLCSKIFLNKYISIYCYLLFYYNNALFNFFFYYSFLLYVIIIYKRIGYCSYHDERRKTFDSECIQENKESPRAFVNDRVCKTLFVQVAIVGVSMIFKKKSSRARRIRCKGFPPHIDGDAWFSVVSKARMGPKRFAKHILCTPKILPRELFRSQRVASASLSLRAQVSCDMHLLILSLSVCFTHVALNRR